MVAVGGTADLLRITAANVLRAAGKSALALSSSLEALLLGEQQQGLTFAEAVLRGVGGFARETKRGVEQAVGQIEELVAARVATANAGGDAAAAEETARRK